MVLSEMFNGTNRWQTFTLPIYMDDVPEGVEELNLTLSLVLDPTLPAGSVNVTPAVATVRILDFSCKLRDRVIKHYYLMFTKQLVIALIYSWLCA